jgi:hypothetical protein
LTNEVDEILNEILEKWYDDIKEEFNDFSKFMDFVDVLKETNKDEYSQNITKYKKKLKI